MVSAPIWFSLSNMQIFKLHYLKNILHFLVALTLTEYDSKYLDTNNIHLYHFKSPCPRLYSNYSYFRHAMTKV